MRKIEKGEMWVCRTEVLNFFTKDKIYKACDENTVIDDLSRKHSVSYDFLTKHFEYIGTSSIQEQKEIEEGERWECIRTVKMDSSGEVVFTKGKIYTAKLDGVFTDDSETDHGVSGEFKDENFRLFEAVKPKPKFEGMIKGFTSEIPEAKNFQFELANRQLGLREAGYKETNGKLSYELDFEFVTQMAERMDANKGKYEPYNWMKKQDVEELKKALTRHFFAIMKGEYEDDGREYGHLESISLNAMMINYQLKNYDGR